MPRNERLNADAAAVLPDRQALELATNEAALQALIIAVGEAAEEAGDEATLELCIAAQNGDGAAAEELRWQLVEDAEQRLGQSAADKTDDDDEGYDAS